MFPRLTLRIPSVRPAHAYIVSLSVLASLEAAAAVWCAVRPDLWMVEHIAFVGARQASPAELRHLANLENGTPVWAVDLQALEAGVAAHPWVRSVHATRDWPDTLTVTVEERTPVALLHYDGAVYYLDELGVPFLRARTSDLDYPSLTGLDPELERRHPDLPRLVIHDALWLQRTLDARGLVPSARLSEIAFSESRGFTVYSGRAEVIFGLDGLERQVDRLATLVSAQGVDLDSPVRVDLAPEDIAIVRPLLASN